MKYVLIIPDGAADEPVSALGGRTPLEAARKPHLDRLARTGQQGCVVTVPQGFSPGSDVATLSLFGYDVRTAYTGRAPLEAAARGVHIGPDELVFRCNFVTLTNGRMVDFTAGHISQPQADALIADLNRTLSTEGCRFFSGVSYRNLMVLSDARDLDVQCTPPHDIPDRPVGEHSPKGRGANRVTTIMTKARAVLSDRRATDIWLWGQGRRASLPSFESRYGIRGAVIAAVDLIRGIAISAGMTVLDVPGATGYLDTDYAAKGRAACEALEAYDLVVVHIEAPDEAGHQGDVRAKVEAIERIDEFVIGPVLEALGKHGDWRVLVAPDHPTPVEKRVHTTDPPPYGLAGAGIPKGIGEAFGESAARRGTLIERAPDLIAQLPKRA